MRFASRLQFAAGLSASSAFAAASTLAVAPSSLAAQAPAVYHVTPDTFWNTLDHWHPVVRHIKPGDVVITKTLDASRYDDHEKQRAASSNPMVGPFYIEGAEPGDALVIHFRKIRLNRATGWSY